MNGMEYIGPLNSLVVQASFTINKTAVLAVCE